jgi:hypothetical protein
MVDRWARWDRIDQRELEERAENSEPAEPIEKAEKNEPMDPIENTDPMEPIERTDPLEAIERTEDSDHNDQREGETGELSGDGSTGTPPDSQVVPAARSGKTLPTFDTMYSPYVPLKPWTLIWSHRVLASFSAGRSTMGSRSTVASHEGSIKKGNDRRSVRPALRTR